MMLSLFDRKGSDVLWACPVLRGSEGWVLSGVRDFCNQFAIT